MRIALDVMGGDNAPVEPIKGAVLALAEIKDLEIVLVGKEEIIKEELKKYQYDKKRIEIKHTDEYILMKEKDSPAMAVRKKKNASMNIALELVKTNEAEASLSAGNTGALMSASLFKLGRIKGVLRPAITAAFPSETGDLVIVDAGANSDCKAEYLDQFSVMGSVYAETIFNLDKPKVGLLNIGEEEGKGNELAVGAYELLKNNKKINFIGNIEPNMLMKGVANVVVTDGFTGNIVLKTAEGAVSFISKLLKEAMKSNILSMLGAILLAPALKRMAKKVDYKEYGAAIFLGVNGISLKSHGSSDSTAIKNGIKLANSFAKADFINKLSGKFSK